MSQIITLLSASGGVGKTMVACALAAEFARSGETALLIDLNAGNRAADLFLGLEGRVLFDLSDVLSSTKESAPQLIITHHAADKIGFIAAPYNDEVLPEDKFYSFIKQMKHKYGRIILDTAAGYGGAVAAALSCCDKSFIIMTAENLAVRSAERLLSRMREAKLAAPDIIINRAIPEYMLDDVQLQPNAITAALDARVISVIRENDRIYRACVSGTIAQLEERGEEYAVFRQLAGRVRSGVVPKGFQVKKKFLQQSAYINEIM
ncbi:MAG: AAA family ATPase [Oscillospiraceae bacterium]|jgi:septum formation inhibitor-activating ATPase MinD|nr:AAA family ATPase [Oscillospiraceae bacterium]